MNWIDLLRRILCSLYQEWGGNCADLGDLPLDWIETVTDEFKLKGAPPLPTQADMDRFLAELDDLDACLADAKNSLDPAQNALLEELSKDLRAAVK